MQTLGLTSLLRSQAQSITVDVDDADALDMILGDAEGKELFRRRLLETKAWCTPRANQGEPAKSLRSEVLRPVDLLGEGPESRRRYGNRDLAEVVAHLNDARSMLLQDSPVSFSESPGKILAFWPDETVHCGASDESSRGFFDLDDTPPWDTWFWYGPILRQLPGIYAWVPKALVELAERGISANPVECMRWLQNVRFG